MSDYEHAFVFVDNHDNQRGHGGGGSIIVRRIKISYSHLAVKHATSLKSNEEMT